jgi:hypothetical protein
MSADTFCSSSITRIRIRTTASISYFAHEA